MLSKKCTKTHLFCNIHKNECQKDFIHQDEAPGIYYSTSIVQVLWSRIRKLDFRVTHICRSINLAVKTKTNRKEC